MSEIVLRENCPLCGTFMSFRKPSDGAPFTVASCNGSEKVPHGYMIITVMDPIDSTRFKKEGENEN